MQFWGGGGGLSHPIFFSLLLPVFASSHSQTTQLWSRVAPKGGKKSLVYLGVFTFGFAPEFIFLMQESDKISLMTLVAFLCESGMETLSFWSF